VTDVTVPRIHLDKRQTDRDRRMNYELKQMVRRPSDVLKAVC